MRRSTPLLFSFGFSLLLGTSILAGAAKAQLEHFNVYNSSGQIPPAAFQPVTITDQFDELVTGLGPPTLFLVPVDKNDEGLTDTFSHLTCYDIVDPLQAPPEIISTNQFGVHTLTLGTSRHLCLPTEKLIPPPGPASTDHFHCYDATGPSVDIGVSLADQFQHQNVTVLDPVLFCNPADKNGSGIQNPTDHLTCYTYTPAGAPVLPLVPIINQFFPEATQLDVAEPLALCVPSLKAIPPSSTLDHFSVYNTLGPDGPVVQLVDQFQDQTTDLGLLNLFLVPADKNQEGILDPISHLACNEILDGEPAPPVVFAEHQFGEQQLNLGMPRELCVPTEKMLTPGTVTVDHFKCYDAIGDPLDISIGFADQFQGVDVLLADPFLFCNPVDKNGEGIQNPEAHLTCYLTAPPGPALGLAPSILNQFLAVPIEIALEDQFAFCLPSAKRLPPAIPAVSARGLVIAVGLIAIVSLGAWRWRSRAGGRFGAQ
jgi:hypothetical protein